MVGCNEQNKIPSMRNSELFHSVSAIQRNGISANVLLLG